MLRCPFYVFERDTFRLNFRAQNDSEANTDITYHISFRSLRLFGFDLHKEEIKTPIRRRPVYRRSVRKTGRGVELCVAQWARSPFDERRFVLALLLRPQKYIKYSQSCR